MGLRINTNIQSLAAQKSLHDTTTNLQHTQNKLSSGSRIIRAADDAAGLAISENLRATQVATGQNITNGEAGILLLNTAEGSLSQISNLVIRMKELAINSANGTNSDKERAYLQDEFGVLQQELDRISQTTEFNGRPLLNGDNDKIQIQIGPRAREDLDSLDVASSFDISLDSLGIDGVDISTQDDAWDSIDPLTEALDQIASVRGEIGASQARLTSSIANLREFNINTAAAFSQIRDADIATETANLAKYNILSQAGLSVLTQANNAPTMALKLLS